MRAEKLRGWTWVATVFVLIRLGWYLLHGLQLLSVQMQHMPSYTIWLLIVATSGRNGSGGQAGWTAVSIR